MGERLIVECADCKRDVTGQAPILLVFSSTQFACLCPECAEGYGSAELAFTRLRALFPEGPDHHPRHSRAA